MSHSRSCQEGVTTPAALQLEWQSASRWYNILFCHRLLWDITGMMNLFSVPDVTAPTDSSNKPRVVFFILGIELSFGGATSSIKREKGATHTRTQTNARCWLSLSSEYPAERVRRPPFKRDDGIHLTKGNERIIKRKKKREKGKRGVPWGLECAWSTAAARCCCFPARFLVIYNFVFKSFEKYIRPIKKRGFEERKTCRLDDGRDACFSCCFFFFLWYLPPFWNERVMQQRENS